MPPHNQRGWFLTGLKISLEKPPAAACMLQECERVEWEYLPSAARERRRTEEIFYKHLNIHDFKVPNKEFWAIVCLQRAPTLCGMIAIFSTEIENTYIVNSVCVLCIFIL